MDEKYIQMIIEASRDAKSAHHRLDSLQEDLKEIKEDVKSTNKIALSVEKIAMEIKAMREDTNNIDCRLKKIEEKPVKEFEETKKMIKDKIIIFGLSIILVFIAISIGLGKFI